ncbi:DUF2283 domain-containing protein [Candidatus Woesearchaeota archaeon]|nr:DUF2283 domain-containing protein [Candidatus Woesearchaeota archaeon]
MANLRKVTADYDDDSDSLSIQLSGRKSSFSIDNGELIVDFDSKKEVVGVEFLNASRILSIISKKDITREALNNIKKCDLISKRAGNTLVIAIVIELPEGEVIENSITLPLISERKLVAVA